MTSLARRICVSLAGVPLLVGVVACSSDPGTPTGSETAAQGGGDGGGSAAPLTAADLAPRLVAAQNKAGTAHLEGSITAGSMGQVELSGDLRLSSANPGAHLRMSLALLGDGIEAILVDKTMYVKVPGLSSEKPWLKLSLRSGPLASSGLGALNMASMLKGLEGALSVKPRGQENVDGVATTRYAVTVDAAKALAAQGLDSLVPSAGKSPKVVYDLWVDDDDLVRKLAMKTGSASVQMTFSAYGEPVTITAPPASEVGKSPAFF